MSFTLQRSHFEALRRGDALVYRGILGPETAAAVHRSCSSVRQMLVPARVGHGDESRVDPDVRSDLVGFTRPDTVPPGFRRLVTWFRALQAALDSQGLALARFHLQIACYPGGGTHYGRHIDALKDHTRVVTAIYYPNVGYPDDSGGQLRLYLADGILDVAPKGDVGVVFLSDRVPHEVLPARVDRFAITAWYR